MFFFCRLLKMAGSQDIVQFNLIAEILTFIIMKNWLGRIRSAKFLTAGFVHFGNALFRIIFVLLSIGALWYAGAFFHAFDVPPSVAWTAVIMLLVLWRQVSSSGGCCRWRHCWN